MFGWWTDFSKKEKHMALIVFFGFLFKYNYLLFRIFYVPSILGGLLRNLGLALVLIFFILPLIRGKRGRRWVFIGYILFSIIFMANYWYNAYFGNYLSFSDMIMGQGTGRFSIVEVLFRHIISLVDILFILDIILLSGLYIKSDFKKKKYFFKKEFSGFNKVRKTVLLLVIVIIFSQILITSSLLGGYTPGELYREGTAYFVNVYGFIPLYFVEMYAYLAPYQLQPDKAAPPWEERRLDGESVVSGKPNIIVIQWESLDEKLINYDYNGQKPVPFTSTLLEESLYFNNFYAQHVNGSFDADFSFLTSLYPVNRNYAYRENRLEEFSSLVRILNEQGYSTLAFHGNDREFFHRNKAFPELGFDRFYARDDYSLEDTYMEVEKTTLGINDYDFFKQSLDFIDQTEQPFFGFFITVTSHTPFDFYPPEEQVEAFKDIDNQLVEDFFHSIAFTDKALEMFFSELEARGLKEDTLFLIYSDHESAIEEEEYTSFRDFNLERNIKQPHHIPLIIKHPDIEPGIINTTGTITDLAPTILDLLGIRNIPDEFAGWSLLEEKERPVLFLHEAPQILYRDQLYIIEQDEFIRVGYREQTGKQEVDFSEEQKSDIYATIDYMRQLFFMDRRRH